METKDELHIKIQSENESDRIKALSSLRRYTEPDLQFAYWLYFDMEIIGKDLHKVCTDNSSDVKKYAAITIEAYFRFLYNKDQLWADLIRLASDEDSKVRDSAIIVINSIYPLVENKDNVWADLIFLVHANYTNVRDTATKIIISVFPQVSSKDEAMVDLSKLALENDCEVRQIAAKVIGSVFPHIPEKKKAWEDLRNLLADRDINVKKTAVRVLHLVFPSAPNKVETWNELHRLVYDDDSEVKQIIAEVIGSVFPYIPEEKKAWEDLHHLVLEDDVNIKRSATDSLGAIFPYASEKKQIWTIIVNLMLHSDSIVKENARCSFDSTLNYVVENDKLFQRSQQNLYGEDGEENGRPTINILADVLNKENAWNNLTTIFHDKNTTSLMSTVKVITYIFPCIPDKDVFWTYLFRSVVIRKEVEYLLMVFAYVPNKEKALEDLIKLGSQMGTEQKGGKEILSKVERFFNDLDKTQVYIILQKLMLSEDTYVKMMAISTLALFFPYLPGKDSLNFMCNKEQAWDDLLALTSEKDEMLKRHTASVLGLAFPHVPDKSRAWKDLHKFTNDRHFNVRWGIANSIGSAFPYIPNKEQAWEDLLKLTTDNKNYVRVSAFHSMGRISVFKASESESEEEYRKELENAIVFFDQASKELTYLPPSKFCLPFYRSFYAIVFEKYEREEDVEKYLQEAKAEIGESKNKKILFEAIENLSIFLTELQNIESIDLDTKKKKLSLCRKYCEQAAELMNETEITAPFATATIKKGFPILNRKLEGLLEEIQEKATTACRESQGTDTEEIACAVSREVQRWEIGSQEEMTWYVENLVFTLESTIPRTPKNQHVLDRISQIREERDVIRQYAIVCTIIPLIPFLSMDEKVVNMEQGISDLKIGLGEVNENTIVIIKKLDEIQEELKEGFEKLDKLSVKVGGKEGENIKIFSEKLLEMTKKGDSEAIEHFLEELLKDESALIKEIDSSSAPKNDKEESKRSLSKLRSLLEKVKNPTKAFGKDVAKEIVVGYAAKEIIYLVMPMMFLAVFGVPMPSHITEILSIVVKELKV